MISRRLLGQELVEVLKQHPDVHGVGERDGQITADLSGGRSLTVTLDHLHQQAGPLEAPDRRQMIGAHVDALVRGGLAGMQVDSDALVLVPIAAGQPAPQKLRRPMAAGFDAMLALDSPTMLMFPQPITLRQADVDPDVAFERAHQNLRSLAFETFQAGSGSSRVVGVIAGDTLEAARLLFCPDLAARLATQAELARPWLLCVPDRSTALLTSGADSEHLLRVADLCHRDYRQADYELSGRPLLLDADGAVIDRVELDFDGDAG